MNEKQNKKLSGKNPSERFQPKVLAIWLFIITMIILLSMSYAPKSKGHVTLTVNQVIEAVEKGEVHALNLKSQPTGGPNWYLLSGELQKTSQSENKESAQEMVSFEAEGRLTDERFSKLTESSVSVSEKPASTVFMEILMSVLPILIIIGLLYLLFRHQLKTAGRGAMGFGKSRAKLLIREKEKMNFNNVAGCDEAKEEVSEIVDFLREPKKFQAVGGRVPKGVLMVGAPGTGKTLLARAVAGEADVPFFCISGSDFVEMFVGVGAARVRDMFEQAKKHAPCIIFVDEIDAVGRQRGAGLGGGNDEREQTLNSLLVEMDGFDAHEGIIIIAATNRPDVLDSALLRPGRFDRQITIDLPDLIGREAILKVHAAKVKLAKKVNLKLVARSTPGFSGADLENLLNEGALIAARHNKKVVEGTDIEEARDKIAYGRERRKLMDDEDKKITAVHEAGHALVQAIVDDGHLPLHKVTIIPRGQSLGSTMFVPKKDILHQSKRNLLNQICCAMGGRIAESMELNDICSGASCDIKTATKIARHMVCDWGMSSLGPVAYGENQDHIFLGKEITRSQNYSEHIAQKIDHEIFVIVQEQQKRAEKILQENKDSLQKIIEALLTYETIEGKHVHEIIEHGKIKSPVFKRPIVSSKMTSERKPQKKVKAT